MALPSSSSASLHMASFIPEHRISCLGNGRHNFIIGSRRESDSHSSPQVDDHYRYYYLAYLASFLVSISQSSSFPSPYIVIHPRCQALLPRFSNKCVVPHSRRTHCRSATHSSESNRSGKQIVQDRTVSGFYSSSTPVSSRPLEVL